MTDSTHRRWSRRGANEAQLFSFIRLPSSSVVAKFFKRILNGESVSIFGDGSQTRDFVYVDDIIDAICMAATSGPGGQVFTIGSGKETTVLQLVDTIRAILEADPEGQSVEVTNMEARPGDVLRNYSSIVKAGKHLGFSPKVDLSEGLEETWRWFRARNGVRSLTVSG